MQQKAGIHLDRAGELTAHLYRPNWINGSCFVTEERDNGGNVRGDGRVKDKEGWVHDPLKQFLTTLTKTKLKFKEYFLLIYFFQQRIVRIDWKSLTTGY